MRNLLTCILIKFTTCSSVNALNNFLFPFSYIYGRCTCVEISMYEHLFEESWNPTYHTDMNPPVVKLFWLFLLKTNFLYRYLLFIKLNMCIHWTFFFFLEVLPDVSWCLLLSVLQASYPGVKMKEVTTCFKTWVISHLFIYFLVTD